MYPSAASILIVSLLRCLNLVINVRETQTRPLLRLLPAAEEESTVRCSGFGCIASLPRHLPLRYLLVCHVKNFPAHTTANILRSQHNHQSSSTYRSPRGATRGHRDDSMIQSISRIARICRALGLEATASPTAMETIADWQANLDGIEATLASNPTDEDAHARKETKQGSLENLNQKQNSLHHQLNSSGQTPAMA